MRRPHESTPQEFATPAPSSRKSSRLLQVQLPDVMTSALTPLPSRLGLPDSFGISPVIADTKKKAAALQLKKRQFEAPTATPVKAASTKPANPAEDDDDVEVDIVLRHEELTERPRRWSPPDFFKRFRSSDNEPFVDSPFRTPTKALDNILEMPSESSSIWDRLKAIRVPDILAEGLAISTHTSTDLLENHDDLYDDNNDADELCCGFDLMNVDHGDDDGIAMSNEGAEESPEHPLTIEFTLTPMTACHHTTHERRTSSRVTSSPKTALPPTPVATATRRRTRSQRKKRLTRGVSMSNVARCGDTSPLPELSAPPRGCTDLCHQWGRFSTCGRMHGRWTPPQSSTAGSAI
ncbi:hypothetical protein DYB32_008129 [Aphanomyces invadans]|uniref:Uncharacterized protein n=1 Tax=Aphanomyces invadans TaxID=157072 RepID=A0A418AM52_9STRA|nr:hypothetical protein DYB32_008129 [Aphanomyces invadans]